MEDIENQTSCFKSKMPCTKFVIAAGISISSFALGCTMLIILPSNHSLIPFYSGLITGAISYWVSPPKYNGS